jgi:hypothetical protein
MKNDLESGLKILGFPHIKNLGSNLKLKCTEANFVRDHIKNMHSGFWNVLREGHIFKTRQSLRIKEVKSCPVS